MFTELLLKNNKELVDYSIFAHKKGLIQPDTYVLDYDSIIQNYHLIKNKADLYNMDTFVMTKQIGRHPILIQELSKMGAEFVAVDSREAQKIIEYNGQLGHVGHLVQIPIAMIPEILSARPKFVTVYSVEQAYHINEYAKSQKYVQNILFRVVKTAYEGQQTRQYSQEELLDIAKKIQQYSNIKLVGLTSFPCFMFDENKRQVIATDNALELKEMFEYLNLENMNLTVKNMPSHNNLQAIPLVAEWGGTQIEPGHALTGTCPYHQMFPNANEEKIALAYVSEVSHHDNNISYIYGGGYYRRSHWKKVFVPSLNEQIDIIQPDPTSIDYTLGIKKNISVGETIIASFRTQIFVTRSQVALVKGLTTGNPHILGISDSHGTLIK